MANSRADPAEGSHPSALFPRLLPNSPACLREYRRKGYITTGCRQPARIQRAPQPLVYRFCQRDGGAGFSLQPYFGVSSRYGVSPNFSASVSQSAAETT